MNHLLVPLTLVIASIIPLASAAPTCAPETGVLGACVNESSYSYGDCNAGYAGGATDVWVYGSLGYYNVYGSRYCDAWWNNSFQHWGFGFYSQNAATGWTVIDWYAYEYEDPKGSSTTCAIQVLSDQTGYLAFDCPTTPPHVPWGELLP